MTGIQQETRNLCHEQQTPKLRGKPHAAERLWVRWVAMSLCLGLCGLLLSGCEVGEFLADLFRINSTALAQDKTRIETVVIGANDFVFTTDTTPDIQIFNGTTRYTLKSSADLLFDAFSGVTRLEAGDILIERPGANSSVITIVRRL